MQAQATLPQRLAARDQRWLRYLGDLQEYATVPQPLESVGTLLRVTGDVYKRQNMSRAQILQQAGNAMVAQANQLPQQVLSLLQR